MDKYFEKSKIFVTGNPVRKDIVNLEGKHATAMAFFGFRPDKPVLLVTGGSLGARTINESIHANVMLLHEEGIQVIWQTGRLFYEKAMELIRNQHHEGMFVSAFIDRMDLAYAAADLVVSRAGAIAVSEICAVQKPAILIPSPNVAEDHQTKNALALTNNHAAVLITDNDAREKLVPAIIELIFDEKKKHILKEKIASLSYRDAADVIASMAIDLVKM
jgi:UDP-N-acetylglucosamine--N-acetylmuramyl-(pentapeptide) pyrophosphoryl-undecaprenol N-acetylglucosamine transferase